MDIISLCKNKLLKMKSDLINRAKQSAADFNQIDKSSGDEIDQSSAHQEEHSFLINQQRLAEQLVEIEFALARIQNGTYGVCEETEELIEPERLLAIPWTRLSIEGAEIREHSRKKKNLSRFAR